MKVRTNYGVFDLETREGKTRLSRGEGVTGSMSAGNPLKEPVRGRQTMPADAFDSKLEGYRARHLSVLVLAGEIVRFKYHPFSIPIGPKKTYTPDFLVEYPDRLLVIEEVKGNLKMKNARDSVTRLHVAAGLLPMFQWRLVIGQNMEERWVGEA